MIISYVEIHQRGRTRDWSYASWVRSGVDFAFKKLFGSEENKGLLISLINAIDSKEDQVKDIELVAPLDRWLTFLTRAPELKQGVLPEK